MKTEKHTFQIHIKGEIPEMLSAQFLNMGCADYKFGYGAIEVISTEEEIGNVLRAIQSNNIKIIGFENLSDTYIQVSKIQNGFNDFADNYLVEDLYNKPNSYILSKAIIKTILETDADKNRMDNFFPNYPARFYVKKKSLELLTKKLK